MSDTEKLISPSDFLKSLGVSDGSELLDYDDFDPADAAAMFSEVSEFTGDPDDSSSDTAEPYIPLADRCLRPIVMTQFQVGGQVVLPCGTRREDRCPPCAESYREVLRRSVIQGMPSSTDAGLVAFVTLTQPSFGPVYRYAWSHKDTRAFAVKHKLRSTSEAWLKTNSPQGWALLDAARSAALRKLPVDKRLWEGDPKSDSLVGTPVNPQVYDYPGQILHNRMAASLVKNTMPFIRTRLKAYTAVGCRISMKILAEFQVRGALHFHAIIVIRPPEDVNVQFPDMSPSLRTSWVPGDLVPAPGVSEWRDYKYLYKMDRNGRTWKHPLRRFADCNFTEQGLIDAIQGQWGSGPTATVPQDIVDSINVHADHVRPTIRDAAADFLTTATLSMPDTATYAVPQLVSWGQNVDVKVVSAYDVDREGDGLSSAQRLASYVSKYVTKSAGAAGSTLSATSGSRFVHLWHLRLETLAQTATESWTAAADSAARSATNSLDRLQTLYGGSAASLEDPEFLAAVHHMIGMSHADRSAYLDRWERTLTTPLVVMEHGRNSDDMVESAVATVGAIPAGGRTAVGVLRNNSDSFEEFTRILAPESVPQGWREAHLRDLAKSPDLVVLGPIDYWSASDSVYFDDVPSVSLAKAATVPNSEVERLLSDYSEQLACKRAAYELHKERSLTPTLGPKGQMTFGFPSRHTAFESWMVGGLSGLPAPTVPWADLFTSEGIRVAHQRFMQVLAAFEYLRRLDAAKFEVQRTSAFAAAVHAEVAQSGFDAQCLPLVAKLAHPSTTESHHVRPSLLTGWSSRSVKAGTAVTISTVGGHLAFLPRFIMFALRRLDFAGHTGGVNYSSSWPVSMRDIRDARRLWAQENLPTLELDDYEGIVWLYDPIESRNRRKSPV